MPNMVFFWLRLLTESCLQQLGQWLLLERGKVVEGGRDGAAGWS